MSTSKHVLLVTNSVTDAEISLIKDALSRAKHDTMPIHLSLVHVIPNLPTCYFNIPSMVILAERYYEEAKNCLSSVGSTLSVDKEHQWLITGRVKNEVLRLADKLDAHFILASSNNIQDFHKSLKIKAAQHATTINTISAINSL